MKSAYIRFAIVSAMLVGTAWLVDTHRRSEHIPAREMLLSFPRNIGGWSGQDRGIPDDVRQILGPGDFLDRLYIEPQHYPINLFIAYFPSQRSGNSIHSPKNCLPGSGWSIESSSVTNLPLPDETSVPVNRYVVSKGAERALVLYWYQAHGRVDYSEYRAKFDLVSDSLRLNRTDGALVRILTPIANDESLTTAEMRAVQFADQVWPHLGRYIPN